jgi:hypothetical protein
MTPRKLMLGAAALWLAAISPAAPAAAAPSAAPAQAKTPAQESFDRYRVLLTNNIFVRDHARYAPREPGPIGPPLSPEEATALRGVVRQGEGANAAYFVFLEDVRTQETTKMRVGDPVCAGKFVNATLDSVEYLKNGVTKRIEIGENLTGAQAVTPTPQAAQPDAANGPGSAEDTGGSLTLQPLIRGAGPSPASTSPPLSPEKVAEQMRLKRLKELGK